MSDTTTLMDKVNELVDFMQPREVFLSDHTTLTRLEIEFSFGSPKVRVEVYVDNPFDQAELRNLVKKIYDKFKEIHDEAKGS